MRGPQNAKRVRKIPPQGRMSCIPQQNGGSADSAASEPNCRAKAARSSACTILNKSLARYPARIFLFLRAGYFMENTLPQANAIRQMGVVGGPLRAALKLPMIATRDIGSAAAGAFAASDDPRKTNSRTARAT